MDKYIIIGRKRDLSPSSSVSEYNLINSTQSISHMNKKMKNNEVDCTQIKSGIEVESLNSDVEEIESCDNFIKSSKEPLFADKHYQKYISGANACWKYILKLINSGTKKNTRVKDSKEYALHDVTHVCILCYNDESKSTSNSMLKLGNFDDRRFKSSNAIAHLKRYHPSIQINDVNSNKYKPEKNINKSNINHRALAFAEMIVRSNQSLNIVEEKSFTDLFSNEVPGRHLINKSLFILEKEFYSLVSSIITPLLNKIEKCNDGSNLPLFTIFQDGLDMKNDHAVGLEISFLCFDFEYYEIPVFISAGKTSTTAKEVAELIISKFMGVFGVKISDMAAAISDTTPSSLLVSQCIMDETSDECVMHLLGLICGYLFGTKYNMVNKQKIYFKEGKLVFEKSIKLVNFFKNCTKKLNELKKQYPALNLDGRLIPQLFCVTRPSSCILMYRSMIRLKIAFESYVNDQNIKKENRNELKKLLKDINWTHILEIKAIGGVLNSWIKMVQTKHRPGIGYLSILLSILQQEFREKGSLQIIDLEKYEQFHKDSNNDIHKVISNEKNMVSIEKNEKFPRKKLKISDLTDIGEAFRLKCLDLCVKYLNKKKNKSGNTLFSCILDPACFYLAKILKIDGLDGAIIDIKGIAAELSPTQLPIQIEKIDNFDNIDDSRDSGELYIGNKPSNYFNVPSIKQLVDEEWNNYDSFISSSKLFGDTEIKINTQNVYNNYLISNPTIWWKNNFIRYPLLSRCCRMFLSIPSSTATQERCFSTLNEV